MKNMATVALFLAVVGASGLTFADIDDDIARSLTMQCSYSDYKTFQSEIVSIETTKQNTENTAPTKKFQRGQKSQSATYIVSPGEFSECIFPSGNRIRMKVGEGTARPYGMCGGDPGVFGSIWVNERKIASRVWFTGHCREMDGNPDVTFKFFGIQYQNMSVEKCHSARPTGEGANDGDAGSESKQPLSVCVNFPDISRFPRDAMEYPPSGKKAQQVGEVELLTGSHSVCEAALEDVKADFYTFSNNANQNTSKLHRSNWDNPSVELPKELAGSRESIFDFDNDGKLDRVIRRDFESNYMDGSVLLINRGSSSTKLSVSGSPMDKSSWFIPCQLSASHYKIHDCPTFSQNADDAGFWMKAINKKDSVYFRARYSTITPFTFRGESFIGVSSQSEDTQDFVAVLKPMPNRSFQPMCLLKRVSENF